MLYARVFIFRQGNKNGINNAVSRIGRLEKRGKPYKKSRVGWKSEASSDMTMFVYPPMSDDAIALPAHVMIFLLPLYQYFLLPNFLGTRLFLLNGEMLNIPILEHF